VWECNIEGSDGDMYFQISRNINEIDYPDVSYTKIYKECCVESLLQYRSVKVKTKTSRNTLSFKMKVVSSLLVFFLRILNCFLAIFDFMCR